MIDLLGIIHSASLSGLRALPGIEPAPLFREQTRSALPRARVPEGYEIVRWLWDFSRSSPLARIGQDAARSQLFHAVGMGPTLTRGMGVYVEKTHLDIYDRCKTRFCLV